MRTEDKKTLPKKTIIARIIFLAIIQFWLIDIVYGETNYDLSRVPKFGWSGSGYLLFLVLFCFWQTVKEITRLFGEKSPNHEMKADEK